MDIELTIEGRIKTLEENFENMRYELILTQENITAWVDYITSIDLDELVKHVKELQSSKSKLLNKKIKIHRLWCQHCKAMQKTNDTVVDCWYSPLDEEKEYAFCASSEDAVDAIEKEIEAN